MDTNDHLIYIYNKVSPAPEMDAGDIFAYISVFKVLIAKCALHGRLIALERKKANFLDKISKREWKVGQLLGSYEKKCITLHC